MALACDHPRPKLNLPGKTPPRLNWAPPSFLPADPVELRRAIQQALKGIYDESMKRFATSTVVPLLDSAQQLREGQTIQGVADGQVLVMPFPAPGTQDPIKIIVTAVKSPATVVHPDGVRVDTLSEPGVYIYDLVADTSQWQTPAVPSNLQLKGIGAGTNTATSGTVVFANANNVSFGMNTAGVVTASASVGGTFNAVMSDVTASVSQSMSNATDTVFTGGTLHFPGAIALFGANVTNLSLANVFFALNSNTLLGLARVRFLGGVSQVQAHNVSFLNANGVSWGLQSATVAAFGEFLTITGSVNTQYIRSIALGTQANSNFFSNATVTNFSGATIPMMNLAHMGASSTRVNNANVFFALRSASGPLFAVARPAFIGGTATGTNAVPAPNLSFIDSNNISWNVATGFDAASHGEFAGITASYLPQIGLVSHVGGNAVSSVTRLAFSDASNVTWSLSTAANAATVFASVAVGGGGLTNIRLFAGTTSNLASAFTFADSNNFSWGLNGSTITGQPFFLASHIGGNSVNATRFAFSNVNNVTLSLSTAASGATLQASYLPQIGLVSHVGGNSVASVTRLAFENASNVTWSLSTAANAATVLASVAAGGGGGITAVNITAGTTNGNLSNFSFANANNMSFQLNGSTISGQPFQLVSLIGADSVNLTRLAFSTNTGADAVNWIVSTAASAMTLRATIDVGLKVVSAPGGAISSGTLEFTNGNGVTWTRNGQSIGASVAAGGGGEATISHYKNYFVEQDFGGASSATAGQMHLFPLHPFYEGFPGRMTASTINIRAQAATSNGTASYAWTLRAGIYTLANSTQLSLLNSASSTFSATTQASATRNNLISGVRDISFHSSQWSAQPVFSQGIQYWMLLGTSTAGSSYPNAMLVNMDRQIAPRGPWGSSQTLGVHDSPFWGAVSTTALPASIGTAGLVSGAGIVLRYAGCMQQLNMGNLRASLP